MANNTSLDELLLQAIKGGATTRDKLMAIDSLRVQTWAVVAERLNVLTKRRALVASKQGWRLGKI